MELEARKMKRCGIFLFFDKDGIVDDYVVNMLHDMKENVEHLLVVCNGFVLSNSLDKLREVSDDIVCRANVGFDVGGYREGLFYLGWKQLENYDEIVLFNYTFFGPIYPFSEMFEEMSKKELDFWGITKHHKVDPDPFHQISYGYIPEHIQSHFLVLRRSLFMSYQYRDYIFNLGNIKSYTDSICRYEAVFTKYFADLGFKWAVYCDSSEYEGYAYNPIMFYAKTMVEEKRCPILKRRSFFTDYSDFLLNTCGESSVEVYEYLKERNLYNLDWIWDNLFRLENISAVHRVLHLNYMVESYATSYAWNHKLAAIIIIEDTKRIDWYKKYLKEMSAKMDIHLFGTKENCQMVYDICGKADNIYTHIVAEHKEQEILKYAAFEMDVYDYVAVARIRDIEREQPFSNHVSWQYADWENLFGNSNIIGNIIDKFQENKWMGMCIPPIPCYGNLFTKMQNGWCGKFSQVKGYLGALGISVNISEKFKPLTPIGGSFWIRGTLLRELLTYATQEDDDVFLLSLPFLLQHMKQYTGVVYNDRYASVEITNQDYMFRENNKVVFKKYGPNYHKVVVERIRANDFQNGEE